MDILFNGLVFGLVDNGVLIFGAYTGYEVDKLFNGNGKLGAIIGAGLGNTVSDALGAVLDPTIDALLGIVVGCLLAMLVIPVVEIINKKVRK